MSRVLRSNTLAASVGKTWWSKAFLQNQSGKITTNAVASTWGGDLAAQGLRAPIGSASPFSSSSSRVTRGGAFLPRSASASAAKTNHHDLSETMDRSFSSFTRGASPALALSAGANNGGGFRRDLSSASEKKTKIIPFPLAQTGEGIAECELIKWFVKVGDTVDQFDPICEVQSDKANIEITSRHAGVVKTICFEAGDIAEVGATLIELEVAVEEGEEEETGEDSSQAGAAAAEQEQEQEQVQAQSHKSEPEQSKLKKQDGGKSDTGKASSVFASPAVRRLAREMSINLAHVQGTGPKGRVLKEDIIAFSSGKDQQSSTTTAAAAAAGGPGPATATKERSQEDQVIPLKGYTRAMFYSMQKTLDIPHFGFHEELNVEHLMQLRKVCKDEFVRKLAHDESLSKPQDGGHSHPVPIDYSKAKLTMMPFLFKALSLALEDYPVMNSSVDIEGKAIIQHARHNIGCAMNTPFGLVVPNVKDVASKSVMDICLELHRLQVLAQSNHLSPEDINGGTITVSNIGTIAGTYANPLIYGKEVAIVALGRAEYFPRYVSKDSDMIKKVPVMPLSWSADHRVVDGATLASFCKTWKSYLESPDKMILHLC